MTIRFDDEDYERLRQLAFDRRMPMNEIVRRAVHSIVSNVEEQAFLLDPDEEDR